MNRLFVHLLFLCSLAVLQYSSLAAEASEPKPLDLAYTCTEAKEGQDEKPPILMLHAIFNDKESWRDVYPIISEKTGRKTCIADLRNHGDSPWSNESDIAAFAVDIPRLMDTLKAPQVILLGHSLGGKVSIHVTLNHPDRVEKLLVEDNKPNGATVQALESEAIFAADFLNSFNTIPAGATEEQAKAAVVQYFIDHEQLDVSEKDFKLAVDTLPLVCSGGDCKWKTNVVGLVNAVINPAFLTESTGQFDGPTLFMYGTESPFKVKEDEDNIMKLFPKARLVAFEGAGHVLHNRPEYVDIVVDFINESK